jgi:hypothetical protein
MCWWVRKRNLISYTAFLKMEGIRNEPSCGKIEFKRILEKLKVCSSWVLITALSWGVSVGEWTVSSDRKYLSLLRNWPQIKPRLRSLSNLKSNCLHMLTTLKRTKVRCYRSYHLTHQTRNVQWWTISKSGWANTATSLLEMILVVTHILIQTDLVLLIYKISKTNNTPKG